MARRGRRRGRDRGLRRRGRAADEPIDELARYLPDGDPGFLTFADLTTVRDQVGLPANADALPFEILTNKQAASPVADFVHGGLGIGLYTCD